jgi:hypothetical protein
MKSKIRLKDADALGVYQSTFDNAESTPEILEALAALGYNPEKLDLGKKLLEETRIAFENSTSTKGKLRNVQNLFNEKKADMEALYDIHRKKAKLAYRDNPGKADLLHISGILPRIYPKWIETVRLFYREINSDSVIQEELAEVNLSMDDINAGLAMLKVVETAHTATLKAKGDSQSSTQIKDRTFTKMHNWMQAYYTAARIGVNDNTQILESFGKVVKG